MSAPTLTTIDWWASHPTAEEIEAAAIVILQSGENPFIWWLGEHTRAVRSALGAPFAGIAAAGLNRPRHIRETQAVCGEPCNRWFED